MPDLQRYMLCMADLRFRSAQFYRPVTERPMTCNGTAYDLPCTCNTNTLATLPESLNGGGELAGQLQEGEGVRAGAQGYRFAGV